jgi:hypothetical protein
MFVRATIIKRTRKPHTCEFCERVIDIGESAQKVFCADRDEAWSHYLCDWCAEHISDVLDGENEHTRGDLHEYVNDVVLCECPNCGDTDYDMELDTRRGKVILSCNSYMEDSRDTPCDHKWEISLDAVFGWEPTEPAPAPEAVTANA